MNNNKIPYVYPSENEHLYYFSQQSAAASAGPPAAPPSFHYPPYPYGDPYYFYPPPDHGRKQKKRETVGKMIGNFFNPNTGRKKTSNAQPRPAIVVPPRGIGPVYYLNNNDVLCGRGGRINSHPGNVQFRDLVQERKKDYLAKTTKKQHLMNSDSVGNFWRISCLVIPEKQLDPASISPIASSTLCP